MEAVPRMPMLAFELKLSTDFVEYAPSLKSFISENYGEDPSNYTKECAELEQLRQNAVHVSRDFMGCSTLKKYYAQLQFAMSRFQMGEGGTAAIPFTWEDVYTGRTITISDIRFEQACVLYNIGSLHSILGAMDNRQSPDGMKVSCTHFQCAAWAYQHLRDYFGFTTSPDMSFELLTFQINLMLAQAQECILEKSMTDNRKSTITAKVAAQIVEYYKLAFQNLEASNASQIVGGRRYKEWKKRLDLKIFYHECVMYLYLGNQSEEQQKSGEKVAYFQAALDKLNECIKLNKGEDEDIDEALKFCMDVVGGKFNSAKKDNDFIYHEKVPELATLPEVKGASLVKGIPFDANDPEISGPDIFRKLVPMEAHQASSVYSEEKAKLLRSVVTHVEDKNQELEQFMSSLSIDKSKLEPRPEPLPQNLLEKCAAISVKPDAIKDLVEAMKNLSNLSSDTESNMREIEDLLAEEHRKEEEFQSMFGKRSILAMFEEIGKDANRYKQGLEKAAKSNNDLNTAMRTHTSNLKMLCLTPLELQEALPSLEQEKSPEDEAVVNEMKRLLEKVDEMKNQRTTLQEQLRQQVHEDDITNSIVTREGGSQEDFFRDQLKKHDKTKTLIEQNLSAQDNILRALTETNAKYANIRKYTIETVQRREAKILELIQSYDVYEDLLEKSKQGSSFFTKLSENVTTLLNKTRRLCQVQDEGRDKILMREKPKAVPPSRPSAPKPGHGSVPGPGSVPGLPNMDMDMDMMDPDIEKYMKMAGIDMAGLTAPVPAPTEPPKLLLKDYLEHMKPNTFGPKAGAMRNNPRGAMDPMNMYAGGPGLSQIPQVPMHASSLPSTQNTSPVHLPRLPASQPGSPAFRGQVDPSQRLPGAGLPQQYPSPAVSPSVSQTPAFPQISVPSSQMPANQRRTTNVNSNTLPPASVKAPGNAPQNNPGYSQPYMQGIPGAPYQQQGQAFNNMQQPNQYRTQAPPGGPPQAQNMGQPTAQTGTSVATPYLAAGYRPSPPASPASQPVASQNSNVNQAQNSGSVQSSVNMMPYGQNMPNQQFHPGSQPKTTLPGSTPYSSYQPSTANTSYGVQQPGYPAPQNTQQGKDPLQNQYAAQGGPTSQYSSTASSGYAYSQTNTTTPQTQGQTGTYVVSSPHQLHTNNNNPPQLQNQNVSAPYPGPQWQGSNNRSNTSNSNYYTNQAPNRGVYGETQMGYPYSQQGPYTPNLPKMSMAGSSQSYQMGQAQATSAYSAHTNTVVSQVRPQLSTNVHPSGYPQNSGSVPPQSQGLPGPRPTGVVSSSGMQAYPNASTANAQVSTAAMPSAASNYPNQGTPVSSYPPQKVPNQASQYHQPASTQAYPQANQMGPSGSNQNTGTVGMYSQGQTGVYPTASVRQAQPAPSNNIPQNQTNQYGQQYPNSQGYNMQTQNSYPVSAVQGGYLAQQPVKQSQGVQGYQTQQPVKPAQAAQGYQTQNQYPNQYGQNVPQQKTLQSTGQQQQQPTQPTQQQVPAQQQQQYPAQNYPQQQQQQRPYQQQQYQQQYQTKQLENQQQKQQPSQQPYQVSQPQQYPQQYQQQQPKPQQATYTAYPQGYNQTGTPGNQQIPNQTGTGNQQNMYRQNVPAANNYGQYNQQQGTSYPQTGYQNQGSPHKVVPQNQNMPQQNFQNMHQQNQQQYPQQAGQMNNYPAQGGQQQQGPNGQYMNQQPLPAQTGLQAQSTAYPQSQTPPVGNPMTLSLNTAPQRASSVPPVLSPSTPIASQPGQLKPGELERQSSLASNSSSLDDILSSCPETNTQPTNELLTPKVVTAEDIKHQKEEELKVSIKKCTKDPYTDIETLNRFIAEVERFEKHVDSLSKPTLSGQTNAEKEWRELKDDQEKESRKLSVAIARCYPLKNRNPDIMPYDQTRVILKAAKDDYINASHIGDLADCCPKFIAAENPLPVTKSDFWLMVFEQGTEVIAMLCQEMEAGKQKNHTYWPKEKGQSETHGSIVLTLQHEKTKQSWIERIITINHKETRQSRSVVHLQFLHWPLSGVPESPAPLLQFINEVHFYYIQQRSLIKPVIVHCSNGIGRTGAFCVIYTGVQEINQGNGIIDIVNLIKQMRKKRKGIVQETHHFNFCYHAVLYYAQDILMKRGILTNKASFGDKLPSPGDKNHHQRKPSEDFIMGTVSNLSAIQSSVAKMSLKAPQAESSKRDNKDGSGEPRGAEVMPPQSQNVVQDMQPPQTHPPLENVNGNTAVIQDKTSNIPSGAQTLVLPGGTGSPKLSQDKRSMSGSNTSLSSIKSGGSDRSGNKTKATMDNLPPSLANLQNPDTLDLTPDPPGKKKITKSSFTKKEAGLADSTNDPGDPLSMLDPLWSMKGNEK